ncbi:MAG: helix-turn-helix domain-containing protein [Coriobacteriia bacterium]|nr:helix-turn-helix domain-containing protein [Coriobacteriia bacterium]
MNVEIAERLANRRREAGYSQEALAEKLGVTRQAVSKWERSESSPDTDNLIALARLYGVSLDELINVHPAIEDDIAFEAADRAQMHRAVSQASSGATAPGVIQTAAPAMQAASPAPQATANADDNSEETQIADEDTFVRINWRDGIHVKDARKGEEVRVGWKGISVKTRDDDQFFEEKWFDDDDDDDQYDKHVSIGIDGDRILRYGRRNRWFRFPFPLIVILGYLLVGSFLPPLELATNTVNPWFYGLFLINLIPLYYMLISAVSRRAPLRFLQGAYPLACVIFFCWMAFVVREVHPAWTIFLTIPIVEWVLEEIRRWRRKRQDAVIDTEPIV